MNTKTSTVVTVNKTDGTSEKVDARGWKDTRYATKDFTTDTQAIYDGIPRSRVGGGR